MKAALFREMHLRGPQAQGTRWLVFRGWVISRVKEGGRVIPAIGGGGGSRNWITAHFSAFSGQPGDMSFRC